MTDTTDVSVVIISWNTKDILRDCLNSVYQQTKGIEFEVIVVDNASTDGSAQMVKTDFPQVALTENPANLGFAAANNQAIPTAAGRYVLLLNSDTVLLDNAIAKSLAFADNHPDAAVVGCRTLNADKTLQLSTFRFPSVLNKFLAVTYFSKLFPQHKFFGRARMGYWDRNDAREVDVVGGCFMLVRRQAIEQVGLMDEQFFMYGEETDWCYRFRQAGWKNLFTPDAEIIHLHGASSSQRKSQMTLQTHGSSLLFFKKHKHPFAYALACLMVAMFFSLRIPYWLLSGLAAKNSRKPRLQRARTYLLGTAYALTGGRRLLMNK